VRLIPASELMLARPVIFAPPFGRSGNALHPEFNPKVRDGEYVTNLSEEWGGFN
jgi:hypothetical protein